jgi:multiple sugar transport system substrate-binding protein
MPVLTSRLRRSSLLALFVSLALGSAVAAPVKLRMVEVITSPERTVLLRGILADFEKANPDVQVELISYPFEQSFEKLLSSVQAGDIPDIAEMPDKWLSLFAGTGRLVDLSPYLKTWANTKKLAPRMLDAGRSFQGKPYTLPYGFYLRALFYNKKLFAAKNLKPPQTFAEFQTAAKLLSDPAKNQYGYCLRGARGVWDSAYHFISGQTGSAKWFDAQGKSVLTSPEAVKGLDYFANLYKSGSAPKASVNWGFNDIVSGFYSGNCAMLDQDPDALGDINKKMDASEFGVVPMPTGPKGLAYPKVGFAGWSIFQASANKDAAWKLTSYLESPAVNLKWAKFFGIIPAYSEAQNDPVYSKPVYQGWFKTLNSKAHRIELYPFELPELGYFLDVLAPQEVDKLLLGQQTAQQTAAVLAEYLNKAKAKQGGK